MGLYLSTLRVGICNMYSIFCDDLCIYNDVTPLDDHKVISPKLVMEDSTAGSLDLTLPPNNVGYNVIERMTSDIVVKYYEEEIWRGRVLTEATDFWKRKKLYCEGELAFLNDTIQPPHKYLSTDTTIRSLLESFIQIHNAKVGLNRQFTVGIVTVDEELGDLVTNYERTLDCINGFLINKHKGHIRIRHDNGVRYIDYLQDYPGTTNQMIEFGKNLLDYSTNCDMQDLVTVIVPRGQRLDTETIPGLEDYLTVASVNEGSIYVQNDEAVENFGFICDIVDWDDVSDPNVLLQKAQTYLSEIQYNKLNLEITALDLNYINPNLERIKLLDQIWVRSKPHGMIGETGNGVLFPVTKIEIALDQPDNTLYNLGTDIKISLTQSTNKNNQEVLNKINSIPSKSNILEEARRNAYQILTGTESGYVHFIKNSNNQLTELWIADSPNQELATKKWVWNSGGLAYMYIDSDPDSETYNQWVVLDAMLMDGSIVADRIASGNLTLGNGGSSDYPLLQAFSGNTLVTRINRNGLYAIAGQIGGFNISSNSLTINDAILSPMQIGCGSAGYGIINLVGKSTDYGEGNYGYIQISNSGNPSRCLDGIRIYGNGKVVRYDGSGNVSWTKYLSNIPEG